MTKSIKKLLVLLLSLVLIISATTACNLTGNDPVDPNAELTGDSGTTTPTEGYMLYIYNADGTVGMEINGTKSASDFCLRTALEDARVFVDSAFLFGITTPATYVVEMYEDSTEDKSFEIGADVTVNGNGHNIVLAEGVTLTNNGTINDATIREYGIEPVEGAAKIGDVYYETIQAAINAAQAGDEIVLLANATVEGTLAIPAGVTIKSNGYTINGSIRMLGDLTLNGGLTITGGLWVGKSGETLTATLSGDKLTASYFMFQRGTYTINADIDAVYGYLSFEGTFEVNSTIHTTGANGEVLYINGNVTLNDGAVLDSDNSVFLNNNNAVLTMKPGSKVDSKLNFTASGAKLRIDVTGLTVGEYTAITGAVTNGTIEVVNNDKLEAKLVGGKIVLSVKPVAMIGTQGYATLAEAVAAANAGETVTLLADVSLSDILVINKAITLDGNGHTLTYTGSNRAIDIPVESNGANVTIKNLTVDCAASYCQRGINYNTNGKFVLNNVTVKGTNVTYALNLPGSSDNCEVTITDSHISGNIALNVWGENATINATNTTFTAVDNNSVEGYAAVKLNNDGTTSAEGSVINITGGKIDVTGSDADDTEAVSNGTATGKINVSDSTVVNGEVAEMVAVIQYAGGTFYSFTTLEEALAKAVDGDTITLLRDVTSSVIITINKSITLDGNGHTLTSTAARAINVETNGKVVISNLTINAGERAVNIINKPATVEINSVVATAKNNAVMIATSAGAVKLTVNDSDFTGLAVVNVAGAGSEVTLNNTNLTNKDATTAESYGAITVFKTATNATVTVNGGKVVVAGDSVASSNGADGATVTFNATEGADKVQTVVAYIGDAGFTTLQSAIDYAKAGNTVVLFADVSLSDILVIDKAITLDGNGHTLTSTAGRAINVSGANGVTIKNLTINAKGERAINVIQNATNVTIDNVTATAYNYTVNVASSAPNAVVTINNSTLNGLCTVNISGAGADITVTNSTVNCNDNNTTVGEAYAALSLNKDATNGKITVTGSTINVAEGSDSEVARNSANGGKITIDGSSDDVAVKVAIINYPEYNVYYSFATLEDAIAFAKNGETVTLIADVELESGIVIEAGKNITLDLNGHTINYTSTNQGESMIDNKGELTINDTVGTGVINYNYVGAADSSYSKGNYTINNAGKLTVNGGKITIANLRAHAKYPINNNSTSGDAILVINGGHLYNYNTSAIRQFCNSTTNQNSVTINGGLIEGYSAIWVQNPGKNTVNATLTITGGEIRTTAAAYVNGTSALKDVSSRLYFTIDGEGGAWSADSSITISGGIFNENVYFAEQAPANIVVDESAATFNGRLELPKNYVAEVNGVKFATVGEAVTYAQNNGITDLVITLISNVDKETAKEMDDSFDLCYKTAFNSVTIKQADNSTPFYIAGIYTGSRTNNGKFIFDGVNIVVTEQYMFEGNVNLTNNSCVDSDAEANCFMYYCTTTIEPGSKLKGVIEDFRGGDVIVDGGRTDGVYNDYASLQDAIMTVRWSGDTLIIRNGAYVNINAANEIGRLNLGTGTAVEVYDSKLDVFQYIDIASNATLRADVASLITTKKITGSGTIVIDVAGLENELQLINADMSGFTGTVQLENNDAGTILFEITDSGIIVKPAVAEVGDVKYGTLAEAFDNANGKTVTLLADLDIVGETITVKDGVSVTLDMNGKKLTVTDNKAANVCYELFYIYGELTVTGNGTIELTSTSNDTAWAKSSTIFHNRGGVLTIENGTYKHLGGTAMAYVVDNNGNSYGDALTTINGGTLDSAYIAIRNRMDTYGANGNPGNGVAKLVVNDGELSGKYAVWGQVSSSGSKGEIVITGGTLTAWEGKAALLVDSDATGTVTTEVSGGTFSSEIPKEYCAEGFAPVANGDGTYGVKVASPVSVETKDETVDEIINNNPVEKETVESVVEEIVTNDAVNSFVPENLPENGKLVIELQGMTFTEAAPTVIVFNVSPLNADGAKVTTFKDALTFRLPVPESFVGTFVKVYHENEFVGVYEINGTGADRYVEVSSNNFSEFRIEATDPITIDYTDVTVTENFKVKFAFKANGVSDWTGFYVVITKTSAHNGAVETLTIPATEWLSRSINGEAHYVVEYAGVAAKEMTDVFEVVIYDANGSAVSVATTDSIKNYAMRKLSHSTDDSELCALLVDMLNYGAEAQNFFSYATDNLANADLTDEQKAYASSAREYSTEMFGFAFADGYNFPAANTLTLDYNPQLKVQLDLRALDLSDDAKITITYVDYKGTTVTKTVNVSDYDYKAKFVEVKCDTLTARDASTKVEFKLTDGETDVFTFATSLEAFTARLSATNEKLDICTALMKYCDSAREYFNK